jgi:mRNA-degrading endonuclease toxin of MazEF toxin-antitoxin module
VVAVSLADIYPRRAHVHWVRIPDEPEGKRRPGLVVSPDVRNRLAADVLVVPLSTVLREAPTHVRLRPREGGLARASMAKCEQITTLRKDRLSARPLGGALSVQRMLEIEKAVLRAIGVPVA